MQRLFQIHPDDSVAVVMERSENGIPVGHKVALKDIKKGEIITNDNVRSIRPAQGLMPKHLKNVLGKKVNRDVSFGEPISLEMIEE